MEESKFKEEELYCMIPQTVINTLLNNQLKILALLESNRGAPEPTKETKGSLYITQRQAMKMLNRRATWFWNMRKRGLLSFALSHKRIYYKRSDIMELVEKIRLGNIDEESLVFEPRAV